MVKIKNKLIIVSGLIGLASYVIFNPNREMNQEITPRSLNKNQKHLEERVTPYSFSEISFDSNNDENQNYNLQSIAEYISDHEGKESSVYCARNPRERNRDNFIEPTIGVGHYMDRGDSRETFARVIPETPWEDIYSGKRELTNEEINVLLKEDLKKYIKRTKDIFPEFKKYPEPVQNALVDGVYRGCLSGSPRTISLINKGMFEEASREYLNHDGYRNAIRNRMSGIRSRMERNSKAFREYRKHEN